MKSLFISDFQKRDPRFRGAQEKHLDWLSRAYAVRGMRTRAGMRALLSRYGAAADAIAMRAYELPDFSHHAWKRMRLFGPRGSTLADKMRFFDEAVGRAFVDFYPAKAKPPSGIVHVTCTGYLAPSPVQKFVAARRWGKQTEVLHAYHMGCYAAHPALRIAAGQLAAQPASVRPVDIVHTELCSLHLDLTRVDPAQLVIQSLFADGYMRYAVQRTRPRTASFELLAMHDELLPDSIDAMTWAPGPFHFAMTLSKDVPCLFAEALPAFVKRLFQRANLRAEAETPDAVFAIHPGGPLILEWSKKALALDSRQLHWSRDILRRHGNISSATLPHIWQAILKDKAVPNRALVVSVGAGPGLTLSGALLRKRS